MTMVEVAENTIVTVSTGCVTGRAAQLVTFKWYIIDQVQTFIFKSETIVIFCFVLFYFKLLFHSAKTHEAFKSHTLNLADHVTESINIVFNDAN